MRKPADVRSVPYQHGSTRTRLNKIVQDHVDGLDIWIRRRMQDDDDGSNQADCAAQLAQCPETFFQEVGPKDSSNEDR